MVFSLGGVRAAGLAISRTSMVRAAKNEAFRDRVERAGREVRQAVEARAVRERRRVQAGVAGRELVDVGEVGVRLEQHVAVSEHRAFGHAGGAAGIEKPGRLFRPHVHRAGFFSEQAVIERNAARNRGG